MAVMAPRESWTDQRLDDLKEDMNRRFDGVDESFQRVDADIRELRKLMMQGFFGLATIMITGFSFIAF